MNLPIQLNGTHIQSQLTIALFTPVHRPSVSGRELWRYYFSKFKAHVTGATCSSASTAGKSASGEWAMQVQVSKASPNACQM